MKNILVVDDVKETTDIVRLILESSGYGCTALNDGKQCVEIIQNNNFDLVLLDLAMPEFTGIDVLHELKKKNVLAKSKIILFSASPTFSDTEIEKLKHEYSTVDHLRKPFTKGELLGVVKKNLVWVSNHYNALVFS